MAFCPNCGTPNTDQAEKCVACGFDIVVPKQKAKFKGTIMMSGIKAPTQPETGGSPAAPPAAATSAPIAEPPAASAAQPGAARDGGRNLSYQKTMLGPAGGLVAPPPPASGPAGSSFTPPTPYHSSSSSTPSPSEPPRPSHDRNPSAAGPYPSPASGGSSFGGAAHQSGFGPDSSGGFSSGGTGSFGGGSGNSAGRFSSQNGGASYESTVPPVSDKPNPGKILAIGCAVALALFCVVGALVYYVVGPKLKSMLSSSDDGGTEAAAWQASISQSLAQVTGLCQVDCGQAGVFFHPLKQASLLGEARALTPERLQKLGDPTRAEASMLDGTGDDALATELGLDPQQCARVTSGGAKVISCSVPDTEGKPSVLRIVHMSGISSL